METLEGKEIVLEKKKEVTIPRGCPLCPRCHTDI